MATGIPIAVRSSFVGKDSRPRDDELDLYGLTHPGRVRADNQDHFLLCTIHPQVVVHGTSWDPAVASGCQHDPRDQAEAA